MYTFINKKGKINDKQRVILKNNINNILAEELFDSR
jgi:hypothetical protein